MYPIQGNSGIRVKVVYKDREGYMREKFMWMEEAEVFMLNPASVKTEYEGFTPIYAVKA